MSRVIKFRAWVEYDGEWIMTHDLAFEEFAPINDLLAGPDNLMQYIGARDRDRTEIYEGDILTIRVYETVRKPSTRRYVVEWDEIALRYKFVGVNPLAQHVSIRAGATRGRVIGNIYEHPQLLERKL